MSELISTIEAGVGAAAVVLYANALANSVKWQTKKWDQMQKKK